MDRRSQRGLASQARTKKFQTSDSAGFRYAAIRADLATTNTMKSTKVRRYAMMFKDFGPKKIFNHGWTQMNTDGGKSQNLKFEERPMKCVPHGSTFAKASARQAIK